MKKYGIDTQLEYFAEKLKGNLRTVAYQKIDPTYSTKITSITCDGDLFKECKQENVIEVHESISQWVARTKKKG